MTADSLSPDTRVLLREAEANLSLLVDELAAVQPDTITWADYRRLNDRLVDNAASLLRVRAAQAIEDRRCYSELESERAVRDRKAAELRKEYSNKVAAIRETARSRASTERTEALQRIKQKFEQVERLRSFYSKLEVQFPSLPDVDNVPYARRPGPSVTEAISAFETLPIKIKMSFDVAAVSLAAPLVFLFPFIGVSLALFCSLLVFVAVVSLSAKARAELSDIGVALKRDCENIAYDLHREMKSITQRADEEVAELESELAEILDRLVRDGLAQAEQIDLRNLNGRQILMEEFKRLDAESMAAFRRFRAIEEEFLARNRQVLAVPETKEVDWAEPAPRQLRLGCLALNATGLAAHARDGRQHLLGELITALPSAEAQAS